MKAKLLVNKYLYSEVGSRKFKPGEIVKVTGHHESGRMVIKNASNGFYYGTVTADQIQSLS